MGENGEKKSLKIRLSTVFLILALIIIGILCCTIYIQKQDYIKQIAYLEDQITLMSTNTVSMQSTIDNLEGKQTIIKNLYEKFFKGAFKKTVDKLQTEIDELEYRQQVALTSSGTLEVFLKHNLLK